MATTTFPPGIELRWGRFLKWENLKIKENVDNFLALTGIETANQLFCPERYSGLTDTIKRLRVQHSVMIRIGKFSCNGFVTHIET